MGLYTKESLEKLRERVDLVEVLSSHIDLKKQGVSYKGLCPFHEEKTPSFMIQKGDSHYHCFGCGAHGDAIQFLMHHTRMTFGEAVESLAEKFRVQLVKTSQKEERGVDKGALREALEIAHRFYQTYLLHSSEGREALSYLEKRGLSLSFLTQFEVGLAPQTGGLLRKVLESNKIREDLAVTAGLLGKEGKNDFFRERITFPIRNATGSVIGFSARKYHEKTFGGKYINTPETPLFKKSRTLFGLNYSREKMAKERKAVIVEGQIDCLRMIEAGFNWTVASLGTAFGEEHVHDLRQLGVLQAYLLFDGDEAGRNATVKVGTLFQKVGIEVRVVDLPSGEDPDSFLKHHGPQKMREKMECAKDYLTFQVELLSTQFDLKSPAQKAEVVQRIATEIKGWEDPVMIYESLKQLARLTHVPEEVVGVGHPPPAPLYQKRSAPLAKNEIDPDRILELDLLRWMILAGEENPSLVEMIGGYLTEDDFWTSIGKTIFTSYLTAFKEGRARDLLSILIDIEGEEGAAVMDEILNKKINLERAEKHTRETIQKLLDRKWLKEKAEIKQMLESGTPSDEEVAVLMKRLDTLNSSRREIE